MILMHLRGGDEFTIVIYLLVAGYGVHELYVQLGVVLGQGLMAIVANQFHHGAEGQWVGEAVFSVPVVDLYQLVVATFPGEVRRLEKVKQIQSYTPMALEKFHRILSSLTPYLPQC